MCPSDYVLELIMYVEVNWKSYINFNRFENQPSGKFQPLFRKSTWTNSNEICKHLQYDSNEVLKDDPKVVDTNNVLTSILKKGWVFKQQIEIVIAWNFFSYTLNSVPIWKTPSGENQTVSKISTWTILNDILKSKYVNKFKRFWKMIQRLLIRTKVWKFFLKKMCPSDDALILCML